MIPTVWHFRKSKTIETIKRAAVPKGNGGVMNSWRTEDFYGSGTYLLYCSML